MKKFISIFALILIVFSAAACGTSFADDKYEEISKYVLENKDFIPHSDKTEFYVYETTGVSPRVDYYGYYYAQDDGVAIADFYTRNKLGKQSESSGGTYFGKPSDGTDWYFTKKITDNWYYFELHQVN